MSDPKPGVGTSVVSGTAWMIAMRWTMRGLGLVSTVIVARLLTPADYGVVAIALIIVGLLETIAYLGVDLSLIKDQSAGRDDYDTAWTVQLIQGLLLAVALLASAPFVSAYFREPRALAVIAWLAVRPIVDGAANIGIVAFRKELDFAREFRFNLYTRLIGVAIQIGAAVVFRNYWALVIGMIASSAIATAMSYLMHPYRPRPTLKKASAIWSFSQWLLVARVGSYLSRRADEFVVGRLIGTAAMGGYHVVYELAGAPTTEIVMPMRRALFPALAKVAGDAEQYRRMMLDALAAAALICCGLGVGLAFSADLVVPLVLGAQWASTAPLLRLLALFSVAGAFASMLEVPLWVAGRTMYSAVINWLDLVFALPVLYLCTQQWGTPGAAASRLGVGIAMVPIAAYLVHRIGAAGWRAQAKAVARPVAAAALMAAAMTAVSGMATMPLIVQLALRLSAGAAVYVTALWLLWRFAGRPNGVEQRALALIAGRLATSRRRLGADR